jgi:twitching motility two-component system response regulator PilH
MPKVMVVDDAYSELQVMETILRSAGYDVLTYLDGEQLEEKIVKERPDVVLLDIVMPKRNVWGMRQGADEYLAKPFTPDQLLALVRRFLR